MRCSVAVQPIAPRYVMNGEQRREASELERCHRRLGATRQAIHGCCCCCCCSVMSLSLSPTPSPDPAQQLSFTSEANDSTAGNRTGTRLKRVRHGRNGYQGGAEQNEWPTGWWCHIMAFTARNTSTATVAVSRSHVIMIGGSTYLLHVPPSSRDDALVHKW